MKPLAFLAVAALIAAPAAAVAQTTTITDRPGIIGTDGKKTRTADGRLCKTMVKLGSRLPTKKVCKTKEQWDAQEAASKGELDELTRRNGTVNKIAGAEGG